LARVAVLSTEKYSKLSRYVSIRAGEAEMADRSSGSGPSIREVAFTVHTQPRMTFPDHGSQAVSLERLILPLVSVPVVTLRALRVSSLDPDAQTLEACLTVDLDLRGEGAIPLTQVIHDLELNSGGFVIGTRLVSDPDQGPSALETTGKKIGALLGRVNLVLPWERGGSDIDLEPHESLEHWLERKIPGANVQAVGVGHAPLEPSTPKMTHTLGPITGTLTHLIAFADQIRRAPGLRGIGEVRLTPPEPNGTDEAPWILDAEVSLGAP